MRLTAKEQETCIDLAHGLKDKEIGRKRNRSPRTITNQAENVKRKLKARNRVHMIAILISRGIIKINMALFCLIVSGFFSSADFTYRSVRYRTKERIELVEKL